MHYCLRTLWVTTLAGVCSLFLLLGTCGCSKEQEADRLKSQLASLEQFLKSKGDSVYHADDLRRVPTKLGTPIVPEDGQEVELRYVLFMFNGQAPVPLETNDTVWAREYKLRVLSANEGPLRYVYGQTKAFTGLEQGLRAFAQRDGEGWLGIPSYLGYASAKLGAVKPNTPLLCLWHLSEPAPSQDEGD